MPNWFYHDDAGIKQGPIDDAQLKALCQSGTITPKTDLETESGYRGKAGQVRGLFGAPEVNPFTAEPASQPGATVYCTNCGSPVEEQAYACMKCGASPVGHRKFCRRCGTALNPEQIVCVKCGAGVLPARNRTGGYGGPGYGGSVGGEPKNKLAAGLLAIFLGWIGVHKFYMGSWGWGMVFLAVVFLTGGFLGLVTGICGLVEGILYLTMSQKEFEEKYSPQTEAPFRW
ncbi:MAG: zinc ribbon domain-containing protein [Thermoguttaceae bacterium]|nr:zinc ribbon domain-containing protein [Thermoguttaceae bacterium]